MIRFSHWPDVRWATRQEQSRNRRGSRRLTINGSTKNLVDWAEQVRLHVNTLSKRLKLGWSPEEAVFTPCSQHHSYVSRLRRDRERPDGIRMAWTSRRVGKAGSQ